MQTGKGTGRNYAVDFLKDIFIFIIIIHHGVIHGTKMYMAVDFFFVISGYYMGRTLFFKEICPAAYLLTRIKKIYPNYILAYCLISVPNLLTGNFFRKGYNPILEIFLLQNVGLPCYGGLNYPMWYLSVLIWGGLIIYITFWIIRKREQIIVPLLIVISGCGYAVLLKTDYMCIEQWNYSGIFYCPMVRGMADISVGMLLYRIIAGQHTKRKSDISPFLLIAVFVLMLTHISDYIILAAEIVLAYYALNNSATILSTVGRLPIFLIFSKYEYFAYLNHALVILLVTHTPISDSPLFLKALVIPALVLVLCMIINRVEQEVNRMVKRSKVSWRDKKNK